MAYRVPITVQLDTFEGPLDLLLYLIQTHEMDISKISLSKITDQYLSYVKLMQELNFDVASEFLVMAATLIHWKSKALLPKEDDENANGELDQDRALTQEELIRQLLEHQRFKEAGQTIAGLPWLGDDVFTRPNRRAPVERVWKEMNISTLSLCYQNLVTRARKRTTILQKETVSITDKIAHFKSKLRKGQLTAMRELISAVSSKPEVVVTFLTSLELSRLRRLKLHQEAAYQDIYLELLESLENFDMSLASGFEAEVNTDVKLALGMQNLDINEKPSMPSISPTLPVNPALNEPMAEQTL